MPYDAQIRSNKLIYQDKPRLKTALEMLRTSMSLEDSLHEVCTYAYMYTHTYIYRLLLRVFARDIDENLAGDSAIFCAAWGSRHSD